MTGGFNGFGYYWQEMVREARGDAGMNDTLFHVHCVSHRVALAITNAYSESGEVGKFLAMVDQLCRVLFLFLEVNCDEKRVYAAQVYIFHPQAPQSTL